MAQFPQLQSGAITQYPAISATAQAVQSIQFLDGSSQRYLSQGRQFRRWQVHLELLSDAELTAIENFFAAVDGDYTAFAFPDPKSGDLVLNCRLGQPELDLTYSAPNNGATSLWVMETNG